jgi:hypothetical protein
MNFSSVVVRAFLVFIAAVVIQSIGGILIPLKTPPVPHQMPWLLLSTAVMVCAMTVAAVRSEWRGWQLGAALSAIAMAITTVDVFEGVFFLKNLQIEWGRIFLMAAIDAALMVPVWAYVFGRRPGTGEHYHPIQAKSRGARAWRFALSDLTYIVLYFTAGAIIFPYVKSFYATQQLPSMGAIVGMQLLVRGPVFVVVCLALTRMLGWPRLRGALAVGMVFTLMSGVAPLLIPNPYFPDAVRWVHFCEVVSENFVFGAVVAGLWGPRGEKQPQALRQAA